MRLASGQQPSLVSMALLSGYKYLGIFTAAHLAIALFLVAFCILITGIFQIIIGNMLSDRISNNIGASIKSAGIVFICFSLVLIIVAFCLIYSSLKFARQKVYTYDYGVNPTAFTVESGKAYPTQIEPVKSNVIHHEQNFSQPMVYSTVEPSAPFEPVHCQGN